MGLDIGAMSNIVLREDLTKNEDWDVVSRETGERVDGHNFYVASVIDEFSDQAGPIRNGDVFEYDEYMHVRAGSYGGYNRWRRMLCNMALGVEPEVVWNNPTNFETAPFFDLINFSDCEGVLCTEACQGLYEDFRNPLPAATAYASRLPGDWDGEYWLDKYKEWMEAFELASKDGCVDFH